MTSSGRSYTGFLKSLFTSGGAASASGMNTSVSTSVAPPLTPAIPVEKLSELDVKGIKGMKEFSRVIYSAERGKLETVLLKPGSGGGASGSSAMKGHLNNEV